MQRVDGSHVTAQRRLDFSAEALGILRHQAVCLLVVVALGVVSAGPGVVEGGLVRPEVNMNPAGDQALPKVHRIANKGYRSVAFNCLCLKR